MPQIASDAKRPRVAVLANVYKTHLHTQHIIDRVLEGYDWEECFATPRQTWCLSTLSREENRDVVQLAFNADDITRIRAKGKIAAVRDIEGSYDLDGDLGVLHDLYRLGVRSAQLSAHNWSQNYADACCSPAQWNGLTPHGHEVVREMNRLGMVINVSHASDDTISQAIDISADPVCATHHGLHTASSTFPEICLTRY
jgi:microsomal dipeptidase-like Zn-dependent dipeptidase